MTNLLENQPTHRQGAPMLDQILRERLRGVCLRIRRCLLIEGVAWVAGFMAVAAMLQWTLDYGTHGMRWSMRAALLALIAVGVAWLIQRRIVSSLRLRPGLADAANLVERRYPQLSSVLVSAVRFSDGQVGPAETNSPALVAAVIGRAAHEAAGMDYGIVVDSTRARRSAVVLLGTLLIGTAAALAWPGGMSLWFSRNILLHNDPWPKQTTLVVELTNGVLLGARGDDLVVDAHAEGVQPRQVEVFFETESGQRGRESMVTVGSQGAYRYRYTFKAAQEDFVFHLRGGDDRTEWIQARLRERPRVVESRIRVVPPAYSRIPPFTLGDGQRSVEVLLGTEVTLSVRPNKPLQEATLVAGTETVATAQTEGDYQVAVIQATKTHTYHFALVDKTGLENKEPVRFSVRVTGDDPPRARLKLPGVGDMITPEALLPIELDYSDTYGLHTAELVYQVSREGAGEQSIPLPGFRSETKVFATSLSWPVASASMQPGEQLTLFARAADLNAVSGPGMARSADRTLRVVTPEEFLTALRRREQELRSDFQRLVDQQEQLRSRLLTVWGQLGDTGGAAERRVPLAALERRQRTLASSVNVVRQRFEQVLSELRVNDLGTRDQDDRLARGIIAPLTKLVRRDLVVAADTIRRWANTGSSEEGSRVDPQQIDILSQMRDALASMIQWEGYHEVVDMLNSILRLQKDLHQETKETLIQEADDVFAD